MSEHFDRHCTIHSWTTYPVPPTTITPWQAPVPELHQDRNAAVRRTTQRRLHAGGR